MPVCEKNRHFEVFKFIIDHIYSKKLHKIKILVGKVKKILKKIDFSRDRMLKLGNLAKLRIKLASSAIMSVLSSFKPLPHNCNHPVVMLKEILDKE